MFSQITQYRDDPIESFQARLMASNNPDKLDLGLGVYRNEQGEVVVFDAVIQAERRLVAQRGHKGYRSPLGNRLYVEQMERLLFGDLLDARRIQGVVSAQTPGAGAACRVAAEYVKWGRLADLCVQKGLLPFVDIAYQGFGDGIEDDLKGMQLMAAKVPEMMLALSSSKSFTVYRERAGLLSLVFNESAKYKDNAYRKLRDIARGLYFMAPDHGAAIVATIAALAQSNVERVARAFLEARALNSAAVA